MPKTKQMNIRIEAELADAVDETVRALGCQKSEFIRSAFMDAIANATEKLARIRDAENRIREAKQALADAEAELESARAYELGRAKPEAVIRTIEEAHRTPVDALEEA